MADKQNRDYQESEKNENAPAVAFENSVVLVRHFFADNEDVEKIFNEYIDEKTPKNI